MCKGTCITKKSKQSSCIGIQKLYVRALKITGTKHVKTYTSRALAGSPSSRLCLCKAPGRAKADWGMAIGHSADGKQCIGTQTCDLTALWFLSKFPNLSVCASVYLSTSLCEFISSRQRGTKIQGDSTASRFLSKSLHLSVSASVCLSFHPSLSVSATEPDRGKETR